MTHSEYAILFTIGFLGMILQALLKMKAIQTKAKMGNIKFSPKEYFIEDWVSHLASIVTLVMFLFFVDEIVTFNKIAGNYLKFGFAFVGYTGSDIMSRIFSVMNKRINSAIDYKTTIADGVTGTLDNPTPAAPIKKD